MSDKRYPARQWNSPFFAGTPRSGLIAGTYTSGSSLRQAVEGGWALGTFVIDIPHPATVTALSLAGFDFVVLDMEHSSLGFRELENLVNACRAVGLTALVRPWGEDAGLIGKALDIGAHGIMAPHVDTPERAQQVVKQSRFAPMGERGFSPLTKFDCLQEPLQSLQQATYVIVQIEGRAALDRCADIAAVPGIDAVFVGPYDLALSIGAEPGSEKVFDAAQAIADKIPEGVGLGIYIDDPSTCKDWARRRFALQCVSFDGRMLSDGARDVVKTAGKPNQAT